MKIFRLPYDAKIRLSDGKIGVQTPSEDKLVWIEEETSFQVAGDPSKNGEKSWWRRGWHKSLDFMKGANALKGRRIIPTYSGGPFTGGSALFADGVNLEAALLNRRSLRKYDAVRSMDRPDLDAITEILYQGVPFSEEGALMADTFPLHLFVYRVGGLPAGAYSYEAALKKLNLVRAGDFSREVAEATSGFPPSKTANFTALLNVDMRKLLEQTAGGSDSLRQCYILAGQMAQRAQIRAAAAGILGVCTPAFSESKMIRLTQPGHSYVVPIYTFSMGYPP